MKHIKIEKLDGGRLARLDEDWVAIVYRELDGCSIGTFTVPKGFVSDGASVPRLLWPLINPWGSCDRGSMAHDFLYHSGLFTRKASDQAAEIILRRTGVGWWTRKVFYTGVRVGGLKAWRAHRKGKHPHGEGS